MLTEKTILISGANSDLAKPVINSLLESTENFKLHLLSHSKIEQKDERITAHIVDLSEFDSIDKLPIIFNNTSFTHYIQFHGSAFPGDTLCDLSNEYFIKTYLVNYYSVAVIVKNIIQSMKASCYGRILLMSTASANHGGGEDSFCYGLSKHSIKYLVKHLSKFFTKYNILTNSISPGFIKTKFHSKNMNRTTEQMSQREKSVRIGRAGKPELLLSIIYSLVFENEFISGQDIKIDGGDFI